MTKEERRVRSDYKRNLIKYFDTTVKRFSVQDMNPDLISDQLKEHTEITPEDSAPKLLFLASDIHYFCQMPLEDFPPLFNMTKNPIKVHCILVDDDINQLQEFIEKVPNDIKALNKNFSFEFRRYDNTKDIANNIDECRKIVNNYLANKDIFPIILIDLNLKGSNKEGFHLGELFFRLVRNEWPQIPIFALTRYRDINTILRMGQLGANGYIYKPSIGLLPLYLGLFLKEKIGEHVLEFLQYIDPEKKHINMMLQHITAWTNMPHVLWYGDKVPIMVEHGITHASNLWSLFNSLLSVIDYKKDFLNLTKSNALAFMMSLWLHDIGHKGNEQYQS
ncbi:MAG: response regulator, partial [Thermodesulfovibrionales bacterium]|nr:response regulator [Thermodesulfovibrionales bacterium]